MKNNQDKKQGKVFLSKTIFSARVGEQRQWQQCSAARGQGIILSIQDLKHRQIFSTRVLKILASAKEKKECLFKKLSMTGSLVSKDP